MSTVDVLLIGLLATCSMWMYLHRACGIYLAISLLSRLNQVVSPGLNNYKSSLINELTEKLLKKKEINSSMEKIFYKENVQYDPLMDRLLS